MFSRPPRGAAWLCGLLGLLSGGQSRAGPLDDQRRDGVEVLTRGPVHEAFAQPAGQQAAPGAFAPKAPPAPVEEVPPDQRPEGDDVQWVAGYWHWDDERQDFIWVSGFWRVPPPGRVWVPGSWRGTGQGWQWVGGVWGTVSQPTRPEATPQARLDYLPEPPASLEAGPPTPPPSDASVYLPGTWVHRGRYVWQPGCWTDPRPGWVWTPACYRWTPAGHVFVDGFWDHPLEERGVLFPPVAIAPAVSADPGFAYTPAYAVQEQALFGSLFVGRGRGSYFFGDYFSQQYADAGYTPWCAGGGFGGGGFGGGGFGISFGFQRGFRDPLFDYYRSSRRADPFWGGGGIGQLYAGRYRGDIGRPPRTLVQQNGLVNTINNTTAVNNTTINNTTVVAPLRAGQRTGSRGFTTLAPDARTQFAGDARAARGVAQQRSLVETQLAARPPRPATAAPEPRRAALDLPARTVARGQAPGARAGGPPAARVAPRPPQAARAVAQPGTSGTPTPPRPTTAARPVPPRAEAVPSPARPQPAAAPQPAGPAPRTRVNPAAIPPRPGVAQPRPSLPVPSPARQAAGPGVNRPQAAPPVTRSAPVPPAPTRPAAPPPAARPQPPGRVAPAQPAPRAAPRQPAPSRAAPQPPAPPRVAPQPPAPPQAVRQPLAPTRAAPAQESAAPRPMPRQPAPPRAAPARQPAPPPQASRPAPSRPAAPPPSARPAPAPSRSAPPAPSRPQAPPRPREKR